MVVQRELGTAKLRRANVTRSSALEMWGGKIIDCGVTGMPRERP